MESAFFTCSGLNYEEIIEFLLRRYHTLDPFYKMPITEFARFWKAAKEQAAREMNYAAWCACLPYMDKDHFIPFEQYNDKCTGKNIDTRPASEILAEVEEIRRKARNNGNVII